MHDLPVYPIEWGTPLRGDWVPFKFRKLRDSRAVPRVDPAAGFYGFLLWGAACEQDPVGTLPDDDLDLANLAGLGRDVDGWRRVREGALFGWSHCQCEIRGEMVVRLHNPEVTDMILEQLDWMDKSRKTSAKGTERSNLTRLRKKMLEAGAHAGLTQREDFVIAVEAELKTYCDSRRTVPNVRRAMDAVSMRDAAGQQVANVVGARRIGEAGT
ncbi:hypothetical protein [Oceanicella sp. SM1341]|uniref:hypothetical protein n=1 Tax=Oceanicella sp. SM1341 TaxID=1548889 RepID=UPI000E4A8E1B|nr:hypothetical protein [Oceanicella sp. SM1341]